MKKLFLSLASVVMLAGFGVANADEPTTLDAAALDGITAAGSQCNGNESDGDTANQNNTSILSPQVQAAALNNIALVNAGDQEVEQGQNQGNFARL